ncbi:sigma 54-interacting transcriptional regulator [Paenibacillus sp. V4I5]|nr:sigma 54-interacting transcriptional regulator [Paenibacillus sp. V4I5]
MRQIGDLDYALQGKLLRVLQENEFRRVGGNEMIRTNAPC